MDTIDEIALDKVAFVIVDVRGGRKSRYSRPVYSRLAEEGGCSDLHVHLSYVLLF